MTAITTTRIDSIESPHDREELAYQLLSSLPRSFLVNFQKRIAPLLQFDVVGSLPTEVSLQILSYLSHQALLNCACVSRRWQALANDQALWKALCDYRGWAWRQPARVYPFESHSSHRVLDQDDWDDEGMGDSDDEEHEVRMISSVDDAKAELTLMHAELDSGFRSMSYFGSSSQILDERNSGMFLSTGHLTPSSKAIMRHSAPSVLKSLGPASFVGPNYKLLFKTHIRLQERFISSSYRLSVLQTRGAPSNAHTSTIYCLQLYTYPSTNRQVLFTGSRDKTVREWNLITGQVERVIEGVHSSSVLSICVHNGYLASAGSDKRVAIWDLEKNQLVRLISDHEDGVLCVRFDDQRLVSCSKDRTVRTYSFPTLKPQHTLRAHRAAVNAVTLSDSHIVSGSGDRSVRLWDAESGKLLRTFENHHTRGIASIDFRPPFVLSGSSDKHVRLIDCQTFQGWSTASPGYGSAVQIVSSPNQGTGLVCQACGSTMVQVTSTQQPGVEARCTHNDLVRSVSLGEDYVVSGSYDLSIKVWDRKTGALVTDLTGGHTGRIFCIGFDCTKIVSCGEDQRICIWDFSHGIDTSFLQL